MFSKPLDTRLKNYIYDHLRPDPENKVPKLKNDFLKHIKESNFEYLKDVLRVLKFVIKDKIPAKPKFYALLLIKTIMDNKIKTLVEYFVKKLMSRLFLIAQFEMKFDDRQKGARCLKMYFNQNSQENSDYSFKFYTLLLECWKHWDEMFSGEFKKIKANCDKLRPIFPVNDYHYNDLDGQEDGQLDMTNENGEHQFFNELNSMRNSRRSNETTDRNLMIRSLQKDDPFQTQISGSMKIRRVICTFIRTKDDSLIMKNLNDFHQQISSQISSLKRYTKLNSQSRFVDDLDRIKLAREIEVLDEMVLIIEKAVDQKIAFKEFKSLILIFDQNSINLSNSLQTISLNYNQPNTLNRSSSTKKNARFADEEESSLNSKGLIEEPRNSKPRNDPPPEPNIFHSTRLTSINQNMLRTNNEIIEETEEDDLSNHRYNGKPQRSIDNLEEKNKKGFSLNLESAKNNIDSLKTINSKKHLPENIEEFMPISNKEITSKTNIFDAFKDFESTGKKDNLLKIDQKAFRQEKETPYYSEVEIEPSMKKQSIQKIKSQMTKENDENEKFANIFNQQSEPIFNIFGNEFEQGQMEMIIEESKDDYDESKRSFSKYQDPKNQTRLNKTNSEAVRKTEDGFTNGSGHLEFEDFHDIDGNSTNRSKEVISSFDNKKQKNTTIGNFKMPNFAEHNNQNIRSEGFGFSKTDKQSNQKGRFSPRNAVELNQSETFKKNIDKNSNPFISQKQIFQNQKDDDFYLNSISKEEIQSIEKNSISPNSKFSGSKKNIFRKEKSLKLPIPVESHALIQQQKTPSGKVNENDDFFTPNKTEKDVLVNFNNGLMSQESHKIFSPSSFQKMFNFKKGLENNSASGFKDLSNRNSDVDKMTPNSNLNFAFPVNNRLSEKSAGNLFEETKKVKNRDISEIKIIDSFNFKKTERETETVQNEESEYEYPIGNFVLQNESKVSPYNHKGSELGFRPSLKNVKKEINFSMHDDSEHFKMKQNSKSIDENTNRLFSKKKVEKEHFGTNQKSEISDVRLKHENEDCEIEAHQEMLNSDFNFYQQEEIQKEEKIMKSPNFAVHDQKGSNYNKENKMTSFAGEKGLSLNTSFFKNEQEKIDISHEKVIKIGKMDKIKTIEKQPINITKNEIDEEVEKEFVDMRVCNEHLKDQVNILQTLLIQKNREMGNIKSIFDDKSNENQLPKASSNEYVVGNLESKIAERKAELLSRENLMLKNMNKRLHKNYVSNEVKGGEEKNLFKELNKEYEFYISELKNELGFLKRE